MWDHRLAALATVALLVLAGCSVGPVGGDRRGETPTLTPAPIPSSGEHSTERGDRSTVGGRSLAPGLRTGGVADPFALAGAHRDALGDRSYTRVDSRTVVDENGTLRATRRELRVARGGIPFRLSRSAVSAGRYDVVSGYGDIAIYHDGDVAYYRLVDDGDTSYGLDTGASAAEVESDRTGRDVLLGLFTSFEWEVRRLEIGGEPRYRLTSTRLVAPETLDDAFLLTDPRDAEVRVLVGPDGRVYRYRLEYDTTYDGRTVGVTETARWSDVGATAVDPPSWLEQARNATAGASRAVAGPGPSG